MRTHAEVFMRGVNRFFVLTFAGTWACFLAAVLASRTAGLATLRWPLLVLGAFMPSTVAVVLTAREDGRASVKSLLRRLLLWRVGMRWWAFALGYMLVIKLLVAATYRLLEGAWPVYHGDAWYAALAALPFAAILGGPLGEEIGWRGYALPRLAERFGLASASVILGVVWSLWHLPVFFIPGLDQFGQSLPVYVLRVIAMSVAFAWLFRNTSGSLLLAVVMHAAVNQAKDIASAVVPGATNPWALSASLSAWLSVLFTWLVAGYLLTRLVRRVDIVPQPAAA
ncbi:MAG TPA: CPBP family intramembrane glutamic endopeptidase [Gemmatimonadaceae bacterium]|nr:CPBP family intramembrane glutamic endopeptidase [Gemmatimonadaceae bacterium]